MNKKRSAMVAILLVAVVVVAFAAPMQRFGYQNTVTPQVGIGMYADTADIPEELLALHQARMDELAAAGVDTSTLGIGGAVRARQYVSLEDCIDPTLCEYEPVGRGPMAASQTVSYGRTSSWGMGRR